MVKSMFVLAVMVAFLLITVDTDAQCAMCKAVAESSHEHGDQAANGINTAILYIMGIPYVLLMAGGILLFRHLRKSKT